MFNHSTTATITLRRGDTKDWRKAAGVFKAGGFERIGLCIERRGYFCGSTTHLFTSEDLDAFKGLGVAIEFKTDLSGGKYWVTFLVGDKTADCETNKAGDPVVALCLKDGVLNIKDSMSREQIEDFLRTREDYANFGKRVPPKDPPMFPFLPQEPAKVGGES